MGIDITRDSGALVRWGVKTAMVVAFYGVGFSVPFFGLRVTASRLNMLCATI